MSVYYGTDFYLDEYQEIHCDTPDCDRSYRKIIHPYKWEGAVKCLEPEWNDEEEGWLTIRWMADENVECRADYCPMCARKLGIGG